MAKDGRYSLESSRIKWERVDGEAGEVLVTGKLGPEEGPQDWTLEGPQSLCHLAKRYFAS
jgi:hypothetical protein